MWAILVYEAYLYKGAPPCVTVRHNTVINLGIYWQSTQLEREHDLDLAHGNSYTVKFDRSCQKDNSYFGGRALSMSNATTLDAHCLRPVVQRRSLNSTTGVIITVPRPLRRRRLPPISNNDARRWSLPRCCLSTWDIKRTGAESTFATAVIIHLYWPKSILPTLLPDWRSHVN